MSSCAPGFQDVDKTKIGIVGGQGANLGALSRIEGILVPEGFCISTLAFKRILEDKRHPQGGDSVFKVQAG